ncbi:dTMP kinase [Paenactinomyces guangxiensis]|uniref:Thymidylate kinase n=1 Tax=Paenactinomyces guangxiensis TaxID=1490290 RepID=A0A7W2AAF8_9BACL|nr:dTMP kinase [Paenactinomyces guangxiensis]MBA4495843.1 dTMP kinase [Paenactinomyces guangxiensis]MBH8592933.1 dTMP kinase [Paenactinomyces guangxiensis]
MNGLFITFEGPEGAGKTTQIARLEQYLLDRKIPCIVVREPGGTNIGNLIRHILLNPELSEMKQRTEILLYAASRAQLVEQVIHPALSGGQVILCDRYVDSSIAYQGYGAMWDINEVMQVNRIATGGLRPDRTYLLDLPVELGLERIYFRGVKKDRMELKEKMFHNRVREGYLAIAQAEPERFRVIRANGEIDEVFNQILRDFECLLDQKLLHKPI